MSRHNLKRQRTAGSQPTRAQEDLFRLLGGLFSSHQSFKKEGERKKGRRGWRGSSREKPDHDLAMCADGGPTAQYVSRLSAPPRNHFSNEPKVVETLSRRRVSLAWRGIEVVVPCLLFFASCFSSRLQAEIRAEKPNKRTGTEKETLPAPVCNLHVSKMCFFILPSFLPPQDRLARANKQVQAWSPLP